ncbi:MAG: ACP S-malonyltransferase [Myxococcales bacterium]|nr:ACP S-malonyltransferase [Myxococcales bacterium]
MTVAFVFPGQGSQEVGMGRALCERSSAARAVFDRADRALDGTSPDTTPLSTLCFDGPAEKLTLTENTQPAILTTSIAALEALRERLPALTPALVAGHSLGEYSALVCAGAISFEDTARLVRLRGRAMQEAVPVGEGAMAAIMGVEPDALSALCARTIEALPSRVVSPANYNAPGQIVVAGHADAVAKLSQLVGESGGRAIPLKVSAPFHCALMKPAADRVREALERITMRDLAVPVVANFDAAANSDAARARQLLVDQVAGAVRWEQTIRQMVERGVSTFVEIGPGKVLAGLIKRIHRPAVVHNVFDPATLDATVSALSANS